MRFNNIDRQYKALKPELDAAYQRVMDSGWVILGSEVEAFENEWAEYTESKYCVGVASGMDALIIALKCCGVGSGDEVIVPANTYIASWLAISAVGATIVPVDCNEYYLIDVERIKNAITKRTKAIMPVHLFGQSAELLGIEHLAEQNDLFIVHDAAQAHGAKYGEDRIGSSRNVTAWSFYPTKNLGALGDAGAITTNDSFIAHYARLLRNYGSSKKYYNSMQGMNSRLDELQAAFLRVKLKYLDKMNERRRLYATMYYLELNPKIMSVPVSRPNRHHVFHQFVVRHPQRDKLAMYLEDNGIPTLIHYPIPPHQSGAYGHGELMQGRPSFPITEEYADTMLSLPIDPFLTDSEVDHIIETINAWVGKLDRFDIVDATFQPMRVDDLKDGVSEYIGKRGLWQAAWMIDEYSESYLGQYAMTPYDFRPKSFTWVPECDLIIHKILDNCS